MKILYFGNNQVGLEVLKWLKEKGEDIVGVVVHPAEKAKSGNEIIEISGLPEDKIFDGSTLREEETLKKLRSLKPDIGLSVFFGYILKPKLLEILPDGCLNLHPALLPFNRGSCPNVWSIIDDTPAGATLHYIDNGIDTGDILAQKEVCVETFDTGKTLYEKLEAACLTLFKENWDTFRNGKIKSVPQNADEGTHYRLKDFNALSELDLDKEYKAGELIDILRARTFSPHRGVYFLDGNRKIYLELKLTPEDNPE